MPLAFEPSPGPQRCSNSSARRRGPHSGHPSQSLLIQDVFCKIINGELKADVVWQDDDFLVIKDINPQAPVHVLIIPKKHYEALHDFNEKDASLLGKALFVAEKVAKQLDIHEKGYRLILNEGVHGGKLVPHLHIHLLGGKPLGPKIVK